MSKDKTSVVALQSKKIDTSIIAVGSVAAAAFAAVLAFAPATGALSLDNVNLSTGVSSQDGSDEWSSAGLRLATQDGLENLGIGTMVENVDGDERQSLNLGIEAVDDFENLALNGNLLNMDGNEKQQAGLGVQTSDYLETLDVAGSAQNEDGDERNNFGIKFSFED